MTRTPQQCVVATYESYDDASRTVYDLHRAGVPDQYVSLVTHDVAREVPHEETLQTGDRTEKDAVRHAGVGGAIGMLLGAPLIVVPGLGPVLWAAPLVTGMTGAIVGGLIGTMQGWGVQDDHIARYERLVRDGGVLVVVCGPADQVAKAQQLLEQIDRENVHLHARTGDDSPEIDDRDEPLLPPS